MSVSFEFRDLMDRVQAQAPDAVGELLNRYGPHILRVVRRRLKPEIRSKFDSTDFVQAVWASFFALPLDDYRFDQSAALAAFLAEMAHHKVVDAVRQRLISQKYNVNRERPIEDAGSLSHGFPSPMDIAIAKEEWEKLIGESEPPHQQILTSLGEGFSAREVADQLGFCEKTVRRVLRRIRDRAET